MLLCKHVVSTLCEDLSGKYRGDIYISIINAQSIYQQMLTQISYYPFYATLRHLRHTLTLFFTLFLCFRWIVGSGAHAGVYPRDPRFRKEIIDRLNKVPGLEVWERHDIPEELHYKGKDSQRSAKM